MDDKNSKPSNYATLIDKCDFLGGLKLPQNTRTKLIQG